MNYYTGIGARKTPTAILEFMSSFSQVFKDTYILRSGGADGADLAFEKDIDKKDIFLPWKGFNNNTSSLFNIWPQAFDIASEHHRSWKYLKTPVKRLMARNVHQVLGIGLDRPSDFLICWTIDGATNKEEVGKDTGGTGLAIGVADTYNVPIYNLQKLDVLETLSEQYKIQI
jgi:hypothetical protein